MRESYSIGVDIGGTKIAFVVAGASGEKTIAMVPDDPPDAIFKRIANEILIRLWREDDPLSRFVIDEAARGVQRFSIRAGSLLVADWGIRSMMLYIQR